MLDMKIHEPIGEVPVSAFPACWEGVMAKNNPLRRKQTEGDTAKIKHDSSKRETQCGEMLRGRSAQRDQE